MLKGLTKTWKDGCNSLTLTYSEYIVIDNKKIPIKAVLKDGCYNNGNFIGSFIFKEISFETENNIDFKKKEFEYYKVVNGESLKLGTFITTEIKDNDTTELVRVVGMDFGLKTQVEYISSLDYSSGLITLLDVWNECCELSGLESGINEFTNNDFIVENDQFTGTGATIRDVFIAIAQSSCSFVKVMNDDKIYLVFKEQTDDVIEDYTELEDKRDTQPITCVRLGMSQIIGENVDLKDEELIKKYGEHWLIINDNPFAYTQAKRAELIYAILDKVKGFGYSAFTAKSSFKPYLTCGDLIKCKNRKGQLINSILLRYEHNSEEIKLEAPSETSATVNYVYPANEIDLIKRTEVIVDKHENKITSLTQQTQTIRDNLENDYYTIKQTDELVQTSSQGVTNTFSEAGGNNVLRNTGLWFKSSEYIDTLETINAYNPETEYYYCDYNPINSNITAYEQTLDTTYGIDEDNNLSRTNVRCGDEYLIEIIDGVDYQIKIDSLGFLAVDDGNYSLNMFYLDSELKPISEPLENPTKEVTGVQVSSPITTTTTNLTIPENAKYMFPFLTKGFLGSGTQIDLETVKNGLSSLKVTYTTGTRETIEGYEFWEGNVAKGRNDKAVGYTSLLLQNGSFSQKQEVPNGNYSISFYYQKLNALANASVVINDKEYLLDSLSVKQFYTGEQDSETGEYITQPIVVTSNHIKIEFKCDIPNGVEIWDLMCNKGTVKLAWSQNQNETTTETVNISKGITITSSVDEDTIFKANYDGIRILKGNGDVKTKFTDKGTETDEAIIKNEAQICGTLVQEVDGQTWFTRM